MCSYSWPLICYDPSSYVGSSAVTWILAILAISWSLAHLFRRVANVGIFAEFGTPNRVGAVEPLVISLAWLIAVRQCVAVPASRPMSSGAAAFRLAQMRDKAVCPYAFVLNTFPFRSILSADNPPEDNVPQR